jgi:hypothetical protein
LPRAEITLPETILLSREETIDGEVHEAVRSVVWFSTEQGCDSCKDVAATFEVRQDGRTFYGGEIIYSTECLLLPALQRKTVRLMKGESPCIEDCYLDKITRGVRRSDESKFDVRA